MASLRVSMPTCNHKSVDFTWLERSVHLSALQAQLFSDLIVTVPPSLNGPIGSNVTLPVTISNNGSVPATNVTVVVNLPPGLEFVPTPGEPALHATMPPLSITF